MKKWWNFSRYLVPILWMGMIFWFSNQPVLPGPDVLWQDFLIKKTAHMMVYAGLFWSLWLAWPNQKTFSFKKRGLIILAACLLFAISDEWHQSFVSGRTATLRDVGFDMLGAIIAAMWSHRLI